MIERIEHNGELLALVMRSGHGSEGVSFITDDSSSLQLGVIMHRAGYQVRPHVHRRRTITVQRVQEVLHVDRGSIRARFYDDAGSEIASTDVNCGDTILLASGGHGFEMLEDARIIEVKQGPYLGVGEDKVRLAE